MTEPTREQILKVNARTFYCVCSSVETVIPIDLKLVGDEYQPIFDPRDWSWCCSCGEPREGQGELA